MPTINEVLHLVIPIFSQGALPEHGEDAPPVAYVHSAPISREVFEANYLLLSKTMSAILTEGLREIEGPRVAGLVLNDIAKQMVGERGDAAKLKAPLLAEIHRLTHVLAPGEGGWETVPYQEALDRHLIPDEDLAEVTNGIVFFTVASSALPRRQVHAMIDGAARLWGAHVSSLNVTEYAASLRTSTAAATSPAKYTPQPGGTVIVQGPAPPVQGPPNGASVAMVAGGRRVASRLPV